MKKIALILSILSINTLMHSVSKAEIQEEICEKKLDVTVSKLIGMTYLDVCLKRVENEYYDYDKYTREQKVFGKRSGEAWVTIHDVKLEITRETCGNTTSIIIRGSIEGAPEDFEYKNILESEKCLLKNILIETYLTNLNGMKKGNENGVDELHKTKENSNSITVVPLDSYTKVVRPPEHMVFVKKDYPFRETIVPDNNRKAMHFVTVFPEAEFDELINEYWEQRNKKSSNRTENTSAKKSSWW